MSSTDTVCDQVVSLLEQIVTTDRDIIENNAEHLKHSLEYFTTSKARREMVEKLYSTALERINKVENIADAEKIITKFEKELEETSKINCSSDSRLNLILEQLGFENGDEDIRTIKAVQNVIDPITKQRMTDPVKNTLCGHTYEKKAILELICNNPKTRCPVVGCTERFVKKSHLVSDEVLKNYLNSLPDEDESLHQSNIISLDDSSRC